MGGMNPDAHDVEEANQLYWESGKSVNQIAEDLGLSKGALYEMISPLASEFGCPLCDAPMRYAHRTAHDKGVLTCSGCETQFKDSDPQLEPLSPEASAGAPAASKPPAPYAARSTTPPVRPANQVLIGTAVLGVGVGLLLARLFGRR